jgi:FMN phosphatase YigB (HAD superfamily)
MIIKNIISDFDNVVYAHTEDCPKRQLHAAAIVGQAYFGISYAEAREKALQSWNDHKNGFFYAIKEHPELLDNVTFHELYRQQQAISQDVMHGVKCDKTVGLINRISARQPFIFASHSSLLSVQHMGHYLGLNGALIIGGTYGMDTLGDEGGQRKDNIYSGIYPWLCEKEGFLTQETVMVEDTAANLKGAKLAGLTTIHIHHGKPAYDDYIDFSFETSYEAFQFLESVFENNGVVRQQHLPKAKIA